MDDLRVMVYLESSSKDAAFHFSVEEYIMRQYPFNEPVLMIWHADKCVMLGSNQIAEAEIDISFAKRKGIQIVRRSSGGGTIFTDMGTLLYTVIQPQFEKYPPEIVKENVAGLVVDALNQIGVSAKFEGRNDILVDEKKVSGLAQYVRYGRICTHGSLLYDTDLETLAWVLRVDEEKFRSKALRSVRSRVTNIKGYMDYPCPIQEFWGLIKQNLFCCKQIRGHTLNDYDLIQIDEIFHERYNNPSWTYGRSPKFSFHNSKRFAGGKVEVYLNVEKGTAFSCSIRGDFLGIVPIQGLEKVFENKLFQYKTFCEALDGVSIQPYLGNITRDELLSCIFE